MSFVVNSPAFFSSNDTSFIFLISLSLGAQSFKTAAMKPI